MIGKHFKILSFRNYKVKIRANFIYIIRCTKVPIEAQGVVSGPHPEFSKIERSAHFSDKKLCYYSSNVRNYFTFLSYQSEIPKFGYDKSFIDSDIGNPSPTITCSGGEIVSPNSHLNPLLDRADIRCQLDDSFRGGVGMNTNNIFDEGRPKMSKRLKI